MEDTISLAKAEFLRAKESIVRALATTADDRINWSPCATARTPVQIVAHNAMAIAGVHGMLTGLGFPYATTAEADASFRSAEKEFTTREQALNLLDQTSAEFLKWLDTVTPEQLASTLDLPFGKIPMTIGITIPADHTRYHVAQLNYLQTIDGDRDWHMDF